MPKPPTPLYRFGRMNRKIFLQINRANNTHSQNLHLIEYQRGPRSGCSSRDRQFNRCTYTNEE